MLFFEWVFLLGSVGGVSVFDPLTTNRHPYRPDNVGVFKAIFAVLLVSLSVHTRFKLLFFATRGATHYDQTFCWTLAGQLSPLALGRAGGTPMGPQIRNNKVNYNVPLFKKTQGR